MRLVNWYVTNSTCTLTAYRPSSVPLPILTLNRRLTLPDSTNC